MNISGFVYYNKRYKFICGRYLCWYAHWVDFDWLLFTLIELLLAVSVKGLQILTYFVTRKLRYGNIKLVKV